MEKILFIDFRIHTFEMMVNKIKIENPSGIVVRTQKITPQINKILKLANGKNLKVFYSIHNKHVAKRLFKVHHCGLSCRKPLGMRSKSVHFANEMRDVFQSKPNYAFLSPVFQTQTHPNTKPLGKIQAFKIARKIKQKLPQTKIILLGGMTDKKFRSIKMLDFNNTFSGFAYIRG